MSIDLQKVAHFKRVRAKRLNRKERALASGNGLSLLPSVHIEPSECEVQLYLFNALTSLGYVVRAEVSSKCRTCRFDLLVYVGADPVRIIEVKKRKGGISAHSPDLNQKRTVKCQILRYEQFGLMVDLVCTMKGAKAYVAQVALRPLLVIDREPVCSQSSVMN